MKPPWINLLSHLTQCNHPQKEDGALAFEVGDTSYTMYVLYTHDNSHIIVSNNPLYSTYQRHNIPDYKIVSEAITALSYLRKHLKRQQKQIKKLLSEN